MPAFFACHDPLSTTDQIVPVTVVATDDYEFAYEPISSPITILENAALLGFAHVAKETLTQATDLYGIPRKGLSLKAQLSATIVRRFAPEWGWSEAALHLIATTSNLLSNAKPMVKPLSSR